MPISSSEARRRKRESDRKGIAAKRAAMTPEERAERRRQYDANYRAAHKEELNAKKVEDYRRKSREKWGK